MSIKWICVDAAKPKDREPVLIWGVWKEILPDNGDGFLGLDKFDSRTGNFDREVHSKISTIRVTHWAEILGPSPT